MTTFSQKGNGCSSGSSCSISPSTDSGPPSPAQHGPHTWDLHRAAGGSVVCVGMAALYHHRLGGKTATLGIGGHIF